MEKWKDQVTIQRQERLMHTYRQEIVEKDMMDIFERYLDGNEEEDETQRQLAAVMQQFGIVSFFKNCWKWEIDNEIYPHDMYCAAVMIAAYSYKMEVSVADADPWSELPPLSAHNQAIPGLLD